MDTSDYVGICPNVQNQMVENMEIDIRPGQYKDVYRTKKAGLVTPNPSNQDPMTIN